MRVGDGSSEAGMGANVRESLGQQSGAVIGEAPGRRNEGV